MNRNGETPNECIQPKPFLKRTNSEFEVEQLNSPIYQAFTVYINFVCITIISSRSNFISAHPPV